MLIRADREEARRRLLANRWLSRLPETTTQFLLDRMQAHRLVAGERFLSSDESLHGFTLLLKGFITVCELYSDGERGLYHVAAPGFTTCRFGMVSEVLETIELAVVSDAQLLTLAPDALIELNRLDPDGTAQLTRPMIWRNYQLLRLLARTRGLSAEQYLRLRLALAMVTWKMDGWKDRPRELALPQSQAAPMLGVARQTLNRVLAHLEAQGLVEVRRRSVCVFPNDRLHEAARAAVSSVLSDNLTEN